MSEEAEVASVRSRAAFAPLEVKKGTYLSGDLVEFKRSIFQTFFDFFETLDRLLRGPGDFFLTERADLRCGRSRWGCASRCA